MKCAIGSSTSEAVEIWDIVWAHEGQSLEVPRLRAPLRRLILCLPPHPIVNWVAVQELKLSYYIGETLLFTKYTHYGNLV